MEEKVILYKEYLEFYKANRSSRIIFIRKELEDLTKIDIVYNSDIDGFNAKLEELEKLGLNDSALELCNNMLKKVEQHQEVNDRRRRLIKELRDEQDLCLDQINMINNIIEYTDVNFQTERKENYMYYLDCLEQEKYEELSNYKVVSIQDL